MIGSFESTSLHTASANFWLTARYCRQSSARKIGRVCATWHSGHKPFVRKAVVVALLLFLGEPDAADVIGLFAGRHADVILAVHRFAIGVAAAVRDPDSGAGAHHRFERGHQAAGGMLDFDAAVGRVLVDVGFAIRQNDNLLAVQMAVQGLLQPFRGPLSGSIFAIVGHAADQFAHVAENRLKLPALLASCRRAAGGAVPGSSRDAPAWPRTSARRKP